MVADIDVFRQQFVGWALLTEAQAVTQRARTNAIAHVRVTFQRLRALPGGVEAVAEYLHHPSPCVRFHAAVCLLKWMPEHSDEALEAMREMAQFGKDRIRELATAFMASWQEEDPRHKSGPPPKPDRPKTPPRDSGLAEIELLKADFVSWTLLADDAYTETRTANDAGDKAMAAFHRIHAEPDGQSVILDLMNHPSPWVRYLTAVHVLDHVPEHESAAVCTLNAVRDVDGSVAELAKRSLALHERGKRGLSG